MIQNTIKITLSITRRITSNTTDLITSKWVRIEGQSMMPTLHHRNRIRISRRAYKNSTPARWDIVLIEHPKQIGSYEIKRIIGLPNEEVQLKHGILIIDGKHIKDPFHKPEPTSKNRHWFLRHDEFIVLGDNRTSSTDSRTFGPIKRKSIIGKAIHNNT